MFFNVFNYNNLFLFLREPKKNILLMKNTTSPTLARGLRHIICFIVLAFYSAVTSAQAQAPDSTSARSIAKPILMLMLYCHAALDTLQDDYEKSARTSELPESKQHALMQAFKLNKLELGGFNTETQLFHVFDKSVKDKAISAGEAHFLELTARKDATLWYAFAKEKCKTEIFASLSEEEDECLNKLNSEIHKCLIGFNERVEAISKSQK